MASGATIQLPKAGSVIWGLECPEPIDGYYIGILMPPYEFIYEPPENQNMTLDEIKTKEPKAVQEFRAILDDGEPGPILLKQNDAASILDFIDELKRKLKFEREKCRG